MRSCKALPDGLHQGHIKIVFRDCNTCKIKGDKWIQEVKSYGYLQCDAHVAHLPAEGRIQATALFTVLPANIALDALKQTPDLNCSVCGLTRDAVS